MDQEMNDGNWGDSGLRCFGMLLDGRAQTTGVRQRGQNATLLTVINVHHETVEFKLPEVAGGHRWNLMIDTNIAEQNEEGQFASGDVHKVTARSLRLLALVPEQ